MQKRYRRKITPYLQPIGDILQKALKKRQLTLPKKDLRIMESWSKSVGPLIVSQTAVDRFNHGVLYIKVSNSVWMQQLQFMKEEIIERLNGALGKDAVKSILFSVGHITVQSHANITMSQNRTDSLHLSENEMRTIEQYTSSVKDTELSEILKRVMMKDLQRRKG